MLPRKFFYIAVVVIAAISAAFGMMGGTATTLIATNRGLFPASETTPSATEPKATPQADLDQLRRWVASLLGGEPGPVSTAPFTASLNAENANGRCNYGMAVEGAGRTEEFKKLNGTCASILGVEPPPDLAVKVSITATATTTGSVYVVEREVPFPIGLEIERGPVKYAVSAYEGESVISFRKITEYGNVYARDLYVNDQIVRFCGIWLLGPEYDTLRLSYNFEQVSPGKVVSTFREWKLDELFPLPK